MVHLDLAWAAGFFDGEGSISRAGRYPYASIGNTDLLALRRFQTVVGLGTISGPYSRHTADFKRKPQWVYRLYGFEKVQALVARLWPWLDEAKRRCAVQVLASFRDANLRTLSDLQPPEVAKLSKSEQLAWAAGFFDGEGCFHHSKNGSMESRITHTDRPLLVRFRSAIGFGKIYGPYHYNTTLGSTRPRYVFTTTGYEQFQTVTALLWFRLGRQKRENSKQIMNRYLKHYACGHAREPERPWHKHYPQCFKPGPKPGTKHRKRQSNAQ